MSSLQFCLSFAVSDFCYWPNVVSLFCQLHFKLSDSFCCPASSDVKTTTPRQILRPPKGSPTLQSPSVTVYDETGTVSPGGEFLYWSSTGAVLAVARWGANGGHNSSWGRARGPQYAAELRIFLYFAAELRILLVYLSESLGRLGQNGGPLGATFFIGGLRSPWPSVEPPLVKHSLVQ